MSLSILQIILDLWGMSLLLFLFPLILPSACYTIVDAIGVNINVVLWKNNFSQDFESSENFMAFVKNVFEFIILPWTLFGRELVIIAVILKMTRAPVCTILRNILNDFITLILGKYHA